MNTNYIKPKRINLKNHSTLNEDWIQNLVAKDPSVLGLGDLILKERERRQPRAGVLDLLLQDLESNRRYEVEVQLGAVDESHIIRTIEYYDIEKKRYPQYEHCAVLIAEDITSRFLNVISLFNGAFPLIAIQMQAFEIGDNMTVVFTKVLDELTYGLVDEDEDALAAPTDRAYWEKTATKITVGWVDTILKSLQTFDSSLDLKYNKYYIGIAKDEQALNFVRFRPKKKYINFEIGLSETDEIDAEIEDAGLDFNYDKRYGCYRIQLSGDDINTNGEVLTKLSNLAYNRRIAS